MSFLDLKHSLPISYLYSPDDNCRHYRFKVSDDQMALCSLLPACEINGKKITFNYTDRYVLHCDNEFIDSPEKAIKKIGLPKKCNREDLDKFATIVNFLSRGMDCKYVKETAELDNEKLTFAAKEEHNKVQYQVSLPLTKNEVHYESEIV